MPAACGGVGMVDLCMQGTDMVAHGGTANMHIPGSAGPRDCLCNCRSYVLGGSCNAIILVSLHVATGALMASNSSWECDEKSLTA